MWYGLPCLFLSGSDRGATSALLEDVKDTLLRLTAEDGRDEDEDMSEGKREGLSVRVSMVEASDCANITSTMKGLIGGLIYGDDEDASDEKEEEEEEEGAWPLAPYDINLLVRWYRRMQARRGEHQPCT